MITIVFHEAIVGRISPRVEALWQLRDVTTPG